MKILLFCLIGALNLSSLESISDYCFSSYDVEEVLCQFSYILDIEEDDIDKTPEHFLKDNGGDCEDFAIMAKYLLELNLYSVTIYIVCSDGVRSHAIAHYKSKDEEGYFSNSIRHPMKDFNINIYCKENGFSNWIYSEAN